MKLLLASLLVLIPFTVHADHLGNLSANEFDPNSTASPYGAGSPYLQTASRMSWHLGSPYSNQSATNPLRDRDISAVQSAGSLPGQAEHGPVRSRLGEQSLRPLWEPLFTRLD